MCRRCRIGTSWLFRCDDPSENVDAYSRALAGGYLGVAAAAAHRKNYQTLMRLQPDQWYHARMSVRVLKLNGRLIGLFVVGPHWQLSG